MKTDAQLKKNFRIFLEKDGLLYDEISKIEEVKEDNVRMAEIEAGMINEVLNKTKDKVLFFVDLSQVSKDIKYMSSGARKQYSDLMANSKIIKTAVVSDNLFFKVMAGFLAKASGVSDRVKWFSNKDQALTWLKK